MAVGDVLACSSDSTLSTYSFTDSDGTVTDGNTVTLSEEGSFSFTCTATVEMDTPCSATASVSGTAVGKKQKICPTWVIMFCMRTHRHDVLSSLDLLSSTTAVKTQACHITYCRIINSFTMVYDLA